MMKAEERTAMARVFADAPIEDVYAILAVAMNTLEERGEDLRTEGCDDCDGCPDCGDNAVPIAVYGKHFKIFFDNEDESWNLREM